MGRKKIKDGRIIRSYRFLPKTVKLIDQYSKFDNRSKTNWLENLILTSCQNKSEGSAEVQPSGIATDGKPEVDQGAG